MANAEQFARIKTGVTNWNRWRNNNFGILIDLNGADLSGVDLDGADLRAADLRAAKIGTAKRANLIGADIANADLSEGNLIGADLSYAKLTGADLSWTRLCEADLYRANLRAVNLIGADLRHALLIEANLSGANLTGCHVYGTSAWNLNLEGAIQKDLVITDHHEPIIQIDRLEVAQFVYLLLNNSAIREVIDSISSKVVLILGRFSAERKAVLDALRNELRRHNYLPVLFDFERPASRDITETVSTLAHMARFVIADITDARSIPQELMSIVPNLPSVPVQPLLLASQREYGMFEHFRRYPWVLPVSLYETESELMNAMEQKVILPPEAKLNEIRAAAPKI